MVVAGLPGDAALVDETLPIAQAAAAYDVGLVDHVNFRDLSQQGFVIFVSGRAAVRDRRLAGGTQPAGWPPEFLGARVFALPGPGASTDDSGGAGPVSDGSTGVLLGRTGLSLSVRY